MKHLITTPGGLILASSSPRRKDLLQRAGLRFSVVPSTLEERTAAPSDDPAGHVRALAQSKAQEVALRFPDSWIVGADTDVWLDDAILGKPASTAEARGMLQRLSGRAHEVYTGYCICRHSGKRLLVDAVRTEVHFKPLSEHEIDWYVQSGEPFDKAGAYAIQGLGAFMVQRISGSYTSVVGLPVCEVLSGLLAVGAIALPAAQRRRP
jgi:septum formation protein